MSKEKETATLSSAGMYVSYPKEKEKSTLSTGANKNNGSAVGYIAANLGLGAADILEGAYQLIKGGTSSLFGGKEGNRYAAYLFNEGTESSKLTEKLNEAYNPGKGMQFAGEVGQGIGQSSIFYLDKLGAPIGTVAFFAGAAGHGVSDAVKQTGQLGWKEYAYGITSGAIEAALEKLSGVAGAGIGKGGKTLSGQIEKMLGKIGKDTAKNAVRTGVIKHIISGASSEFFEEFVGEYADTFIKRAYQIDPDAQYSFADAVYAGLVGAASGGIMEGVQSSTRAAYSHYRGSRIIDGGKADSLLRAVKTVNENVKSEDWSKYAGREDSKNRTEYIGALMNNLVATYNAYMALDESQRTSDKAKLYLGEMEINLANLEAAYSASLYQDDIAAHAEDFVEWASKYTGETFTAEDIRNNKDNILRDLAAAKWAGLFMNGLETVGQYKMRWVKQQIEEQRATAAGTPLTGPDLATRISSTSGTTADGIPYTENSEHGVKARIYEIGNDRRVLAIEDNDGKYEIYAGEGDAIYSDVGEMLASKVSADKLDAFVKELAENYDKLYAEARSKQQEVSGEKAEKGPEKGEKSSKSAQDVRKEAKTGAVIKGRQNVVYATEADLRFAGIDPSKTVKKRLSYGQKATAELMSRWFAGSDYKIVLFEGSGAGVNGAYRGDTLYLDVNASMLQIAAHELVHSFVKRSPAMYESLKDFVIKEEFKGDKAALDAAVADITEKYKKIGDTLDRDSAIEEIVAKSCERVFSSVDALKSLFATDKKLFKSADKYLAQMTVTFEAVLSEYTPGNEYAKAIESDVKAMQQLRDNFAKAMQASLRSEQEPASASEGEVLKAMKSYDDSGLGEVDRAPDGEMVIAQNGDGDRIMYSVTTFEEYGRRRLAEVLKEQGYSKEDAKIFIEQIERRADFLKGLAETYKTDYSELYGNLYAAIATDITGAKQVLSALVTNGEYPVNIDLQLICKKRVAYMKLMSRLLQDGVFGKVKYDGETIALINKILAKAGYETACLGCFVESRRQQLQAWAELIAQEWNDEVRKVNPDAEYFPFAVKNGEKLSAETLAKLEAEYEKTAKNDKGNTKLGQGSVKTKMGALLQKRPSLARLITADTLLTPDGLKAIRTDLPGGGDLISLIKSRYGAASPKLVQEFNPYNSELADLSFAAAKALTGQGIPGRKAYEARAEKELAKSKPVRKTGETKKDFDARTKKWKDRVAERAFTDYLFDIGGARIQSFSDFMIENVFDYFQIMGDLAARRLPMHGYTKEIIAARLFGMTGTKWNGSLIAHVEKGQQHAGLMTEEQYNKLKKNGKIPKGMEAIKLTGSEGQTWYMAFDDYARHTADENSFIQSIGMKDIMALILDPRYSGKVGNITIGVSDEQIIAMLRSPYFRMVIPYHASGMLPEFAKLVGTDMYTDYTAFQNTRIGQLYDLNGNPVATLGGAGTESTYVDADGNESAALKADTNAFMFNERLQAIGDAKATADAYLAWCRERHEVRNRDGVLVGYCNFLPKFSGDEKHYDFTQEENYYKLLEDFDVYDAIDDFSGKKTPAMQHGVEMIFPGEGGSRTLTDAELDEYRQRLADVGIFDRTDIDKIIKNANLTVDELIAKEVESRSKYKKFADENWESTVAQIEETILGRSRLDTFRTYDDFARVRETRRESLIEYEPVRGTYRIDADGATKYNYADTSDPELEARSKYDSSDETVNPDYLQFIVDALSEKDLRKRDKMELTLGPISDKHAKMVSRALKEQHGIDLDLSGYTVKVRGSEVWHIEKQHGKNGKRDHSLISLADTARGFYAAQEADGIFELEKKQQRSKEYRNSDNSPAYNIGLYKRFPDGALIVAEAVPDSNSKTLWIVSEYKTKKDIVSQELNIPQKSGPQLTSMTPLDNDVFDNSIPQKNAGVKGKSKKSYVDSDGDELSADQAKYFKKSKIRDSEGHLLKVYHGTDKDFTVFDRTKGRSTMDIQGSFFSPWEIDAGGYGPKVRAYYLNITNPAPESIAYRVLNRFKGQNDAGVRAREALERMGYDGVNNGDEEYIAFYPEQIKLIDNKTPTTDPDTRYSYAGTAYLTEERVDKYLKDFAIPDQPTRSQAWIGYMDPKSFIPGTTDIIGRIDIYDEVEPLDVERLKSERQPIFFTVKLDANGKPEQITGHEGRHRMTAMGREGIWRAPVILFDGYENWEDNRQTYASVPLFGQGRGTDMVFVHDAIPLDYAHREDIIKQFSELSANDKVAERLGRSVVKYSAVEPNTGENGSNDYTAAEYDEARTILDGYDALPAETRVSVMEFLRSAKGTKADRKTLRAIANIIAESEDLDVRFADTKEKGAYIRSKEGWKLILLDSKLESAEAIRKTLSAEVIHMAEEGGEGYEKFARLVIAVTSPEEQEKVMEKYREFWKERGQTVSNETLLHEAISELGSEIINDYDIVSKWSERDRTFVAKLLSAARKTARSLFGKNRDAYRQAAQLTALLADAIAKPIRGDGRARIAYELGQTGTPAEKSQRELIAEQARAIGYFTQAAANRRVDEYIRDIFGAYFDRSSAQYIGNRVQRDFSKKVTDFPPDPVLHTIGKAAIAKEFHDALYTAVTAQQAREAADRIASMIIDKSVVKGTDIKAADAIGTRFAEFGETQVRKALADRIYDALRGGEAALETDRIKLNYENLSKRLRKEVRIAEDEAQAQIEKARGELKSTLQAIEQISRARRQYKDGNYRYQGSLAAPEMKLLSDAVIAAKSRGGFLIPEGVRKAFIAFNNIFRIDELRSDLNEEYEVLGLNAETLRDLDYLVNQIVKSYDEKDEASMQRKLSELELDTFADVARSVAQLYRTYNKYYDERRKEWIDADETASRGIENVEQTKKLGEADPKLLKSIKAFMSNYGIETLDPLAVARMLDGYADDGVMTEIITDIINAENSKTLRTLRYMKDVDEFIKKTKGFEKHLTAESDMIDYRGVKLTREEFIQLYMTAFRKQALLHLGLGRMEFGTNESKYGMRILAPYLEFAAEATGDTEKRELSMEDLESGSQKVVDEIKALGERVLTAEDREYIRLMEHFYNEVSTADKKATDLKYFGMTNVIEDPNDRYVPIVTSSSSRASSVTDERSSMLDFATLSGQSFNKNTVKGAKNPLSITGAYQLMQRHANGLAAYVELYAVMQKLDRIWSTDVNHNKQNSKRLRDYIKNVYGDNSEKYIRSLMGDIQGINTKKPNAFNAILGKLRSNYAIFQLGANPKTWFNQLGSMGALYRFCDLDSILRGIAPTNLDKMAQYSDAAAIREGGDVAVKAQSLTNEISGKVKDLLMRPIGWSDMRIVGMSWGACQYQVQKEKGYAIGTEENLRAAGELLNKVINESQDTSLASTKTGIARSDNEVIRSLAMFRSAPFKQYSRMADAIGRISILNAQKKAGIEVGPEKLAQAKRELARTGAGWALQAAIGVAITALFHWLYKKDDEMTAKDVAIDYASELINVIPVVGDAFNYLASGYDLSYFAFDMLNEGMSALQGTAKMAGRVVRGDAISRQDIAKMINTDATALGQFFGIPTRNVKNFLTGITKRISSIFGGSLGYRVDAAMKNKSYVSDLKTALESGNDRLAETIVQLLYSDKKATTQASERAVSEVVRLYGEGYTNVLPPSVSDTITVDGVEYKIGAKEQKKIRSIANGADSAVTGLISSDVYKGLDDADRAKAIKKLYSVYYDRAISEVFGMPMSKDDAISRIGDEKTVFAAASHIANITSDKDSNGKVITNSRKNKASEYIKSLGVDSDTQMLILYAAGYSSQALLTEVSNIAATANLTADEYAEVYGALGLAS